MARTCQKSLQPFSPLEAPLTRFRLVFSLVLQSSVLVIVIIVTLLCGTSNALEYFELLENSPGTAAPYFGSMRGPVDDGLSLNCLERWRVKRVSEHMACNYEQHL